MGSNETARAKRKARLRTLERQVRELEAQLASTYYFASRRLPEAAELHGSGVVVQMHAIGGREVLPPVCIRDGLSPETVAALLADLRRSYDAATRLKPSEV